jgi:flagellar motility protein MotE (MotC chaperone)
MPERNGDELTSIRQRLTTLENQVGDRQQPGTIQRDITEVKTRLDDVISRQKADRKILQALQKTESEQNKTLKDLKELYVKLDAKLDTELGRLSGTMLHGMTEIKNLLRSLGAE